MPEGGGQRRRPFEGSTRWQRLPSNWDELREEGKRRNPQQVCHWCGRPGGTDFDHKNGDWTDNRQDNLDWIHSWRDVKAGRSRRNCHGEKTGAEGAAARVPLCRPEDVHPALR